MEHEEEDVQELVYQHDTSLPYQKEPKLRAACCSKTMLSPCLIFGVTIHL